MENEIIVFESEQQSYSRLNKMYSVLPLKAIGFIIETYRELFDTINVGNLDNVELEKYENGEDIFKDIEKAYVEKDLSLIFDHIFNFYEVEGRDSNIQGTVLFSLINKTDINYERLTDEDNIDFEDLEFFDEEFKEFMDFVDEIVDKDTYNSYVRDKLMGFTYENSEFENTDIYNINMLGSLVNSFQEAIMKRRVTEELTDENILSQIKAIYGDDVKVNVSFMK